MTTQSDPRSAARDEISQERVFMTLLAHARSFTIEEILEQLPTLTWSEIFLAIDALSRRGDIALYRHGFTYTVELAPHPSIAGETNG